MPSDHRSGTPHAPPPIPPPHSHAPPTATQYPPSPATQAYHHHHPAPHAYTHNYIQPYHGAPAAFAAVAPPPHPLLLPLPPSQQQHVDSDDDFDRALQRFEATNVDYDDPELRPYKVKIVRYGCLTPVKQERQATVALTTAAAIEREHGKRSAKKDTVKAKRAKAEVPRAAAEEVMSERARGKQRSRELDDEIPARGDSAQFPYSLPTNADAVDPGSWPGHPSHPPYPHYPAPYHDPYAYYEPPPVGPYHHQSPPGHWRHHAEPPYESLHHPAAYHADPHYASHWVQPHHSGEATPAAAYYSDHHLWGWGGTPWPGPGYDRSSSTSQAYGGPDYDFEVAAAQYDDVGADMAGYESALEADGNSESHEPSSEPPERLRPTRPLASSSMSAQPRPNLAQTLLSRRGEGKQRRSVARDGVVFGVQHIFSSHHDGEGSGSSSQCPEAGPSRLRSVESPASSRKARLSRAQSVVAPRPGAPALKRARSVGASGTVASPASEPRRRGRPPKTNGHLQTRTRGLKAEEMAADSIFEPEFELLGPTELQPQHPDIHTLYVDKARRVAWMLSRLYRQQNEAGRGQTKKPQDDNKDSRHDLTASWSRWTSTTATKVDDPSHATRRSSKVKSETDSPILPPSPSSEDISATKGDQEYTSLIRLQFRARRQRDFLLDFSALHRLSLHPPSYLTITKPTTTTTAAAASTTSMTMSERKMAQMEEKKRKVQMHRLYTKVWRVKERKGMDDRRLWIEWMRRRQRDDLLEAQTTEQRQNHLPPSPPLLGTPTTTMTTTKTRLPFLRRNLRGYARFLRASTMDDAVIAPASGATS